MQTFDMDPEFPFFCLDLNPDLLCSGILFALGPAVAIVSCLVAGFLHNRYVCHYMLTLVVLVKSNLIVLGGGGNLGHVTQTPYKLGETV